MISILLTLLLLAISNIFPVSAQDDGAPPAPHVYLNSVAYGGSGCPQGSLSITFPSKDDSTIFAVDFTQFVASIGPGIPITQTRKNCQLNLNFSYTSNYQYALRSVLFEGYANIHKGINATVQSVFYFSGSDATSSSRTSFSGPRNETFEVDDVDTDAADSSLLWSPCNGILPLNVNSQVRLSQTNYNASGTVSGLRIAIVRLGWRKCSP